MDDPVVLRYAAFTVDGAGGNPAGVVLDAVALGDPQRLAIAARLGYSETAFVEPGPVAGEYRLRFFSPLAEVAFCGHATIATAIALAERAGPAMRIFHTPAGPVPVRTSLGTGGLTATLTSVATRTRPALDAEVDATLRALGWRRADLDPHYPAHVAYAGNEHLILATRERSRLADLRYDFDQLAEVMAERGWTTLHLVHAQSSVRFAVRAPFPPGGVVEDPATGAAAAAFGGYLRALSLVDLPAEVTLHQGEDTGRPSRLLVRVRGDDDRVEVSGAATSL